MTEETTWENKDKDKDECVWKVGDEDQGEEGKKEEEEDEEEGEAHWWSVLFFCNFVYMYCIL